MAKKSVKLTSKVLTGVVLLSGVAAVPANAIEVNSAKIDVNKKDVEVKLVKENGEYFAQLVSAKNVTNVVAKITVDGKEYRVKHDNLQAGKVAKVAIDMSKLQEKATKKLPTTSVVKETVTVTEEIDGHKIEVVVSYDVEKEDVAVENTATTVEKVEEKTLATIAPVVADAVQTFKEDVQPKLNYVKEAVVSAAKTIVEPKEEVKEEKTLADLVSTVEETKVTEAPVVKTEETKKEEVKTEVAKTVETPKVETSEVKVPTVEEVKAVVTPTVTETKKVEEQPKAVATTTEAKKEETKVETTPAVATTTETKKVEEQPKAVVTPTVAKKEETKVVTTPTVATTTETATTTQVASQTTGTFADQIEAAYKVKVNQLRAMNGLSTLSDNAQLNNSAQARANYEKSAIINGNVHGTNGSKEKAAAKAAGYNGSILYNVAQQYVSSNQSAEQVADSLINRLYFEKNNVTSSHPYGHRNTLLNTTAYTQGVGVAVNGNLVTIVQHVGYNGGYSDAYKASKYLDGKTY